jgi:hypothetical protein
VSVGCGYGGESGPTLPPSSYTSACSRLRIFEPKKPLCSPGVV